jgi:hypothetical protein
MWSSKLPDPALPRAWMIFSFGFITFEQVRHPFYQAQIAQLLHSAEEVYCSIFAGFPFGIG